MVAIASQALHIAIRGGITAESNWLGVIFWEWGAK